ncbi:dTDP-4-dehydrorhamnose reductase [Corynebacterium sp. sy039]|uniref:dTDP-4-dehydrorhamnose reductase n=1 Tax=Corynebacterium sp. sy039 TaxID=2599641 RepID=UPI001FEFCE0A|nr:dTDP-4-dehydrorhamnose reductase [Corynebacterium sp. sy039]
MVFSAPLGAHYVSEIDGLMIFQLSVHGDHRGWFKENWQREKQLKLGLPDFSPVQNNISYNAQAGVTRGLHAEPWDKYISVASGKVFGVWCDLRPHSPTYKQVYSTIITPDKSVFVPRGVANGFQALEPTTYTYLVNEHWSPEASYAFVNIADPALGIDFPIPLEQAELSEKDRHHPLLADAQPVPEQKILVLGAGGQLGSALKDVLPQAEYLNREELDISHAAEVDWPWSQYHTIINAAAYTNVDAAQQEVAQAWQSNAHAVATLSEIARHYRITLVHISSDYVFDGSVESHDEEELPSPLNVYGQSKAAGDLAASLCPKHYIVRTSWVVGNAKNFVSTMAELALAGKTVHVVDDQYGRPTFTHDLAAGIAHLLRSKAPYGVYNLSNSGEITTWYELAQRTFAAVSQKTGGCDGTVQPISTARYCVDKPGYAPRPSHSALDLRKIRGTGFTPRSWQEGLEDYLEQYMQQAQALARVAKEEH